MSDGFGVMRVGTFNLYYGGRAHFGGGIPGWRWLDLRALASAWSVNKPRRGSRRE
jgi:hypothetical protein